MIKLNIQLFAANTQKTTTDALSLEMRTYYHDTLIDQAEPYLVHDQFAQEINIPEHGGKTVDVRYFDLLPKATTALTEAVTPDGTNMTMGHKTATVAQYGAYISLSDMISVTAVDPMLVQATKAMGSQAGRSLDTITRDVITAGTSVMYCPKYVTADGVTTKTAVSARSGLDNTAIIDVDTILKAAAKLEAMLADPINGSYVCIIHPYVAYDLMRNEEFIEWHKYASPEELFKGEIGMIGNVRFVKTTEAKVILQDTTNRPIFLTMVLGKDAYATTYAKGLGLEHIVKPLGAGEDPLNQRCTVGWKATKTAMRLKEQNMVRIECCSSLGANITAAN